MNGILRLNDSWCEHGLPVGLCNHRPHIIYLASPLGLFDFADRQQWQAIGWQKQLSLLRQTLEGIQTLHEKKCLHRDIQVRNLLVMSHEPPVAVLHDFGKVVFSPYARDSAIGPIPTVAPEVNNDNVYTYSIDIWSWAYAVLVAYGHARDRRDWINEKNYIDLLEDLTAFEHADQRHGDLAALLRCMLKWEPKSRPTIQETLAHSCWNARWRPLQGRLDDARKTQKTNDGIALQVECIPQVAQRSSSSGSESTLPFSSDIPPLVAETIGSKRKPS